MSKVLITDRFESIGLKKGLKFLDEMKDNFTTTDGERISLSRLISLFPDDFENTKRPTDEYLIKKGILKA
jgi:hypothetical protein